LVAVERHSVHSAGRAQKPVAGSPVTCNPVRMSGVVRLDEIEASYDAVPRAVSTIEEVGPFTLFLADADVGWQFYARPSLGVAQVCTADDGRGLLSREEELGVPRAIEWVDQVTPSLLPAVVEAGEK